MYTVRKNHRTTLEFTALLLAAAIALPLSAKSEPITMNNSDLSESAESLFGPKADNEQSINADTVLATVNGDKILFADLQERLKAVMGSIPPNIPPQVIQQQIPRIMTEALNSIIVENLIEKSVKKNNITVSNEEVEKKLNEIKSQIPDGKDLSSLLAAQNTKMDEFKGRLKKDLEANKLIEQNVKLEESVSDEKIAEFYESNKQQFVKPEMVTASHILIGFEDDDDDTAKQAKLEKLKELRKNIVSKKISFADAAKDNSTCPSSEQGGSLGTFKRGQMVPAFEEVAFSQKPGEISEPVETQFGYHLIMVDERSDEETIPLEEAKDNIKRYLIQTDRQQKIGDYISSLREDADVNVLIDLSKINASQAMSPKE